MTHPPDDAPLPWLDRPALRAALAARRGRGAGVVGGVSLCPAIDAALPGGGLPRAALHEVLAEEPEAAAEFCALLLGRAAAEGGGSLLWIAAEGFPGGLGRFGLSPADLLLVRAVRPEDALWAMEEGLGSPGIAGAVLCLDGVEPMAVRRLQQAAGTGGGVGLLLRRDAGESGAATRWRVGGGSAGLGDPRWRLELLRCRAGRPGQWEAVWRPAKERLEVEEEEVEARPQPLQRRAR
jgi:protein ImuA